MLHLCSVSREPLQNSSIEWRIKHFLKTCKDGIEAAGLMLVSQGQNVSTDPLRDAGRDLYLDGGQAQSLGDSGQSEGGARLIGS